MSTNRQARELFAQALEMDEAARNAFLDEQCGPNAGLRLEVEQMLEKGKQADAFFGDSDGVTLTCAGAEAPVLESEGDRIGPYILRQKIGEGGFGVVWMAEQTGELSRMVALKVVKAGMDTRQVLARFEAERQALAMMEHPHIAKVLDAGATPAGRPYFVMELVRGVGINRFCKQQKLGHRERLHLFQDVCSAVGHAHQKGLIHRDLKPSNIMVTLAADKPVVKVIDFGIAKATHCKLTERTLFTRFEQFMGTPAYMSPEQATMSALDIDTRSDIYSLGVLLYELMTGTPPFDQESLLSEGWEEMCRIIREEEPPTPSTRLSQVQSSLSPADVTQRVTPNVLRGELDWIIMKAIDKDRSRRYETAGGFAADIERHLVDEPVEAAAPSAVYRFRKFTRRHKAAFRTAAVVVLLLLGGVAATIWQALRATSGMKRAVAAEALAEERLQESEAARKQAEAFSIFLRDILESQLAGYWVLDMEKTLEAAKTKPHFVARALMPALTFEFREGQTIIHGPGKPTYSAYELKRQDQPGYTLVMEIPGQSGTSEATIEGDLLTLRHGDETGFFNRISKQEFDKRHAAAKPAAKAKPEGAASPAKASMAKSTINRYGWSTVNRCTPEVIEEAKQVKPTQIVVGEACGNADFAQICEWPWIREMRVESQVLTDISPLAKLTELTSFKMFMLKQTKRQRIDIGALGKLKKLEKIEFYASRVTNTGALAGLTALKDLSLYMSAFESLDFLEHTPSVERLILYGGKHTFDDYKPLLHLKRLKELDITANAQAVDGKLSVLEGLTTLEALRMPQCVKATTLDFLRNCGGLREINARMAIRLEDIDAVRNMPELMALNLYGTGVEDLSVLAKAEALQRLDVGYTVIKDFSPLAGLKFLRELEHPEDLGEEQLDIIKKILTTVTLEKNQTETR